MRDWAILARDTGAHHDGGAVGSIVGLACCGDSFLGQKLKKNQRHVTRVRRKSEPEYLWERRAAGPWCA